VAVVAAGATLASSPLGSILGAPLPPSPTVTDRSATAVAAVTRLESPAEESSDRGAISSVRAERLGTASACSTEDRGRRGFGSIEAEVLSASATGGIA